MENKNRNRIHTGISHVDVAGTTLPYYGLSVKQKKLMQSWAGSFHFQSFITKKEGYIVNEILKLEKYTETDAEYLNQVRSKWLYYIERFGYNLETVTLSEHIQPLLKNIK